MNAKNILLVEDDVNLGTIIKEYLSIKGFTVTHSLNGETGLASFKQNKFDICIIDIMMPKMDGFSLSKKIKEISSTPFIFLKKIHLYLPPSQVCLGSQFFLFLLLRVYSLKLCKCLFARKKSPI